VKKYCSSKDMVFANCLNADLPKYIYLRVYDLCLRQYIKDHRKIYIFEVYE